MVLFFSVDESFSCLGLVCFILFFLLWLCYLPPLCSITKTQSVVEIQTQTSATSSDVSQREAADVGSHNLKLIFS